MEKAVSGGKCHAQAMFTIRASVFQARDLETGMSASQFTLEEGGWQYGRGRVEDTPLQWMRGTLLPALKATRELLIV